MFTTLKRIDINSALRIGMVVYGLLFAIFGVIFVVLQLLFITGITRYAENDGSFGAVMGVSAISMLCFYGVGVVVAAILGGIQFAVIAFCYNVAANWVGGIQVELATGDGGLLDEIERTSR